MSTNFLPWNSGANNQESDSAYNADSARINGASVNSEFASATANKLFFQSAGMAYCLAAALAAKGYTVNDSPQSTLIEVLGNLVTSADVYNGGTTLAYAANVTANCALYSVFDLTLSGANCNILLSGYRQFQTLTLLIRQDATGGRTAAINALGVGPPSSGYYTIPLSSEPNSVNVLKLVVGNDSQAYATGPVQSS